SPEGALSSPPEEFLLPAQVKALALGHLDDDYMMDVALGAGSEVMVIHGRDRKLSLDEAARSGVEHARITRHPLSFSVQALATGNFIGDARIDIGALSKDGAVVLLARDDFGSWKSDSESWHKAVSTGIPSGNSSAKFLV